MHAGIVHRIIVNVFEGYVLGEPVYGLNYYKNNVIMNGEKIEIKIVFSSTDDNYSVFKKAQHLRGIIQCKFYSKLSRVDFIKNFLTDLKEVRMLTKQEMITFFRSRGIKEDAVDYDLLWQFIQRSGNLGCSLDLSFLLALSGTAALKGKELDNFAKMYKLSKRGWFGFESDESYRPRLIDEFKGGHENK